MGDQLGGMHVQEPGAVGGSGGWAVDKDVDAGEEAMCTVELHLDVADDVEGGGEEGGVVGVAV